MVSFGAIFGLTTGTFTSFMGQPCIFYWMAKDGLLFPIFGIVNPTTRVPTAGILIMGVVASMLACFIPVESLGNMISLGMLMVFTFVDAGVIILRWSPGHLAINGSHLKSHGIELHHDGVMPSMAAHEWMAMGSTQGLLSKIHEGLVWFSGYNVNDNGIKPWFAHCCLLLACWQHP